MPTIDAQHLRAAIEQVASTPGFGVTMPRFTPADGAWWATIERRSDGAVVDYLAVDATLGEDGATYTCRGDWSMIQQFNRALERVTSSAS